MKSLNSSIIPSFGAVSSSSRTSPTISSNASVANTGQEALKDRRGSLSSRQRSAFILFDGKRTMGEVLAATAAMGITQDDVQTMIAQGLLAPLSGQPMPVFAAATTSAARRSIRRRRQ